MRLPLLFVGGLLLTALASFFLTPLVERVAHRKQWTDAPDDGRRIHTRRTPRVGGLAIVASFLLGIGYFALLEGFIPAAFVVPSEYVVFGGVVIAAAGFFDDLYEMHFAYKFAIQILLACFLLHGGYQIDGFGLPFSNTFIDFDWWLSGLLTIVWVVGTINAVNLLDGMDGLAAGVAVIAFGSMAAAYAVQGDLESLILVVAVVGALIGFLYHNFNPASIFMGDTGSLFVGFLLATFSLRGTGHANPTLAFLIPIIALGVPVIDTGLAVVRRFLEQKPLFRPDRDHIHHRVARHLGLSHRNTVLTLYGVSVALGAVAFTVSLSNDYEAGLLLLASAGVIYFMLHQLGYLRVRDTLRLLRRRVRRAHRVRQAIREHPEEALAPPQAAEGNGQAETKRSMPAPEPSETPLHPVPSEDDATGASRGDGFVNDVSLSEQQKS